MTEVKKKVATKKTTATRKTTKKEPVQKEVVEQTVNPMEAMMNMMTPEMMQQFMNFMQQQNRPKEEVVIKEEKPKLNKSYLNKIREQEVVVRSVSVGVVGFRSRKTGIFYRWMNFGDTEILTVGEILEMENSSKSFLHTPWLVIEDDDVNESLGLTTTKDGVEVFDDIETFLEQSVSEIKSHISKLDKSYLENALSKIQQAIDDDILNDVRKIRDIEKSLKCEFKY